jgi:phospholipase C
VDSEHPSASSPAAGAQLMYDVLDAIASHPEVWAHTALFVTFDEFDGYFDHVPPPVPPVERTEEFYQGKPIGLGFRVPTTVVSPWSVGGYVSSETFDHTSVIQFLERWTGVREPNISDWRRTVAGDLTSTFDFRRASRQAEVSAPGPVPAPVSRWRPSPPADQSLPKQEPGSRPARALPCRPEAWAKVEGRTLVLTLRNFGTRSAHFTVYPYGGELAAPRHVDVLGLQILRIPLAGTTYSLEVHGPAGFRRTFTG